MKGKGSGGVSASPGDSPVPWFPSNKYKLRASFVQIHASTRTGRLAGSEGQRPARWSTVIPFSGITHPVVPDRPQGVQDWLRGEGGGGLGPTVAQAC